MDVVIPWLPLVGPVLAALVAVVGWFAAHRLNVAKDLAAKRRDLRIQYLLEAYRRLEGAAHRSDEQKRKEFESAIADIQLFGNPDQIALVHQLIESMANDGFVSYNPLLEGLRKALRHELAIQPTDLPIKIFRMSPPPQSIKHRRE